MDQETEYLVTEILPEEGQIVKCFGHKTLCCDLDMDKEPAWHVARFRFNVCYLLKKQVPDDPRESIIEKCDVDATWKCLDDPEDVIGMPSAEVLKVYKWKKTKS